MQFDCRLLYRSYSRYTRRRIYDTMARSEKLPEHLKNFMTECEDGSFLPLIAQKRYLPDILDMDIRPSDVMVISWPKSGTTWLQYIISQILSADVEDSGHAFHKHLFLECTQNWLKPEEGEGQYKMAEGLPDPRLLKSHLQANMLPKRIWDRKPKVIYIVRNPKDTAISYFFFCQKLPYFPVYKDWSEFFEYFCDGLLPYGDWFDHVLPWWEKRNEPNVLFIRYEDLKKNPRKGVLSISDFLDKSLSEEQLKNICEKASFEAMKENPKTNPDKIFLSSVSRAPIPFMRKGIVGDWKNYFTVSQNERFDKLYQEKMEGSGLQLDFE